MEIIIRPKRGFGIDFRELWRYRELLYIFTWRDIKVRYKQTFFGVAWVLFQPVVTTAIFSIFFGKLAKIPSDNIHYPIFVFIGLMFWQFFSSVLNSSANSLISNENIIKKVYFPRIMAPISSTFAHLIDIIPTIIILVGLLFYYKISPTIESLIFLPILLLIVLIFALGIGMFLAPLNAKYRDIRYILPFFIQLGMFATPVIYPTSLFGGSMRYIRIFNPVAEAIEVTRLSFFTIKTMDWTILLLSVIFTLLVFIIGFYFFRKQEGSFIDIL